VSAAREAGAKVLLVGDWAQLSALEAGGAFRLLVADRGDMAPELSDVQRFRAEWEKRASLGLRLGKEDAVVAYEAHGRVTGGEREALLDQLYRAWRTDIEQGRESLMVAPDSVAVSELNGRARSDRVTAGQVAKAGLVVADGQGRGRGGHPGEQPAPFYREAVGEKRRPLGGASDKPGRQHGRPPPGR
jgi:AAA domain